MVRRKNGDLEALMAKDKETLKKMTEGMALEQTLSTGMRVYHE